MSPRDNLGSFPTAQEWAASKGSWCPANAAPHPLPVPGLCVLGRRGSPARAAQIYKNINHKLASFLAG